LERPQPDREEIRYPWFPPFILLVAL
jgi:hypothetical protein